MTLHRKRDRAHVFEDPIETDIDRLRFIAASKLQECRLHVAASGSVYIYIGDSIKIRYADHEKTTAWREEPDYNIVNRNMTDAELEEIASRVSYPRLCKKTAIAKHLGLTIPKLKKLLPTDAYEDVCEDVRYPNTFTQYVVVKRALEVATAEGILERIPVAQECRSYEDYNGS